MNAKRGCDVVIDTAGYVNSHRREPRGRGSWAFAVKLTGDVNLAKLHSAYAVYNNALEGAAALALDGIKVAKTPRAVNAYGDPATNEGVVFFEQATYAEAKRGALALFRGVACLANKQTLLVGVCP